MAVAEQCQSEGGAPRLAAAQTGRPSLSAVGRPVAGQLHHLVGNIWNWGDVKGNVDMTLASAFHLVMMTLPFADKIILITLHRPSTFNPLGWCSPCCLI